MMQLNPSSAPASARNPDVNISYLVLRLAIGGIGVALPLILVLGPLLIQGCTHIQISISHYYYSIMHFVFIFTLSALGIFLITYQSHSRLERWVSNLAGIFAIGVALFPTEYAGFQGGQTYQYVKVTPEVRSGTGLIHLACALALFICFIIFCLRIFQQSDEPGTDPVKKSRRNRTYKICGWIIILSIAGIAFVGGYNYYSPEIFMPYSVFIFETTALLAFGISWLLKGSLLWKDSKRPVIKYFR